MSLKDRCLFTVEELTNENDYLRNIIIDKDKLIHELAEENQQYRRVAELQKADIAKLLAAIEGN